jgi:type I restriction enzyme S subunit
MSNFKEIYFNDFVKLNRGFDLPNNQILLGEYPVVASTEIKAFHKTYKVKGPGVITGRSGSLGVVQYVTSDYWPLNTALYVKDFKGNDEKYVYYFLQTMHLENFNSGAGVPSLNQNHLHKQKIFVPNLLMQKNIASILSAYDDLIEVNNQRIKLLEETAQQLYKEWFVRMRFPNYKKAKFEKGIPKLWKLKPIGDVIDYHIGGGWGNDDETKEFSVSGYVIRGTDIPKVRKGDANLDVYRFHKASNIKSRELIEGDIVFETAGGSEGQPLGRTCFITQEILDHYGDKVMAASFCKQIRTTSIPSLFLYYYLNYLYDTGMIQSFQVQSTGISNYQFEPFLKFQQIMLPEADLMQEFHDKVMPMQKQIAILGQQNAQLRQIRDRLLPRLISGKLQVKEKKELKKTELIK